MNLFLGCGSPKAARPLNQLVLEKLLFFCLGTPGLQKTTWPINHYGIPLIRTTWHASSTTKNLVFGVRFAWTPWIWAMVVTKPYEFVGFGAMDVTKPYEFTKNLIFAVRFAWRADLRATSI